MHSNLAPDWKRRSRSGAKSARAQARYDNAGDYIHFKRVRKETYGPVRAGDQPRWLGLGGQRSEPRGWGQAEMRSGLVYQNLANAKGYGPPICTTRGYNPSGISENVGNQLARRHLRSLPPKMRDGQRVVTEWSEDDGGGTMVYVVVTTCWGGTLRTQWDSEGS